ncbi:MAG: hypothetical protein GY733_13890 [bacterium]|nr:hypothetical protein [bacterium]
MIDVKLKALRRDYEQYFLGARPREPANLRAELQKTMIRLASGVIKNTGERFRFNTINSQFLTYKRHWDDTLRKMEGGTYKRHVFKANLHDRERGVTSEPTGPAEPTTGGKKPAAGNGDIFDSYMKAAESCGQNTEGLTAQKLQAVMDKQAASIKKKLGAKDVAFRVEVVEGKVKLKARATKAS